MVVKLLIFCRTELLFIEFCIPMLVSFWRYDIYTMQITDNSECGRPLHAFLVFTGASHKAASYRFSSMHINGVSIMMCCVSLQVVAG